MKFTFEQYKLLYKLVVNERDTWTQCLEKIYELLGRYETDPTIIKNPTKEELEVYRDKILDKRKPLDDIIAVFETQKF